VLPGPISFALGVPSSAAACTSTEDACDADILDTDKCEQRQTYIDWEGESRTSCGVPTFTDWHHL
jgi:hypothetical protein